MSFNSLKPYAIVADIGGTFARFACVHLDNLAIENVEIYTCAAVYLKQSLTRKETECNMI